MNTDQSQKTAAASPCGCSPAELKWCAAWIDSHRPPCEWDQAMENLYLKELREYRAAVAQ